MQEQCTTILCAAWKLLDGKCVQSVSVDPADPRDDKQVVIALHKQLMRCAEENIVIVWQNGDRFDLRKINARVVNYRLPQIPKITTIDTLKKARALGFDYNRLDYLDKYLHGDKAGKVETRGFAMWRDIISRHTTPAKARKALKEMVHYNKGDIISLERVFNTLMPYMHNFPNANLFNGTTASCPRCGSANVICRKKPQIRNTQVYRRLSCNDCNYWFTQTKAIPSKRAMVKAQ